MEEEEWDDDFVVAPIAVEAPKPTVQEEVLLPVVVQETQNHPLIGHNGVGEENELIISLPSHSVGGLHQEEENEKLFVEIVEPTAVTTTQDQILLLGEHDHLEEALSTPVTTLTTTLIPNALPTIEEKCNDIMSEAVNNNDEKSTIQGVVNEAPRMSESDSIHIGEAAAVTMEIHNDPNTGVDEAIEIVLLPVVVQETLNHPLIGHNDVDEENVHTFPLPSHSVGGLHQEEENEKLFVEIVEPTAVTTTQDQILLLGEHDHLEEALSTPVTTLTTTLIPNALPTIEEKYNDIMSETAKNNDEKIEAPRMSESDSIHIGEATAATMEIHNDANPGVEEAIEIVHNEEIELDDNAISITHQSATDNTHMDELKVDEEDVLTILVDTSSAAKTHIDEGNIADSVLPSNTSCDDDTANSLVKREQWDGDEEWDGDDDFVTAAISTIPAVTSDAVDFDDEMQSLSPSATTTEHGVDLPCPPEHDHEKKQVEEEAIVVVNNIEEDEDEWADFEGPVTSPPPITTSTIAAAATAAEVPLVEVPEADLAEDRRVGEASTPVATGSTTTNSLPTEQEAAVPITNTSQDSASAVMRSTKTAQEVEVLRDVLGDRASLYASLREKCDMVFGDNPPLVSFPVDSKLPWGTVLADTTQAPNWAYAVDESHCTSDWSREQIQHALMATIPTDAIKINPRYDGLWLWVSNAKSHFVPVSAVPLSHAASSSALHTKPSPPVHAAIPLASNSLGQVDKGTSPIQTVTRATIIRSSSPPQSPPYSPPSSPRQKIQLQPSSQTRPIGSTTDKNLGVGEWDIGEGKEVIPTPLPPRSAAPPPSLPSSGNSSSSSSSLSSSASAGMRKLFSSFGSLPAGDMKKPPSVTAGSSTSSGRSIDGIGFENDTTTSHTNVNARSSSSSSSSTLSPLPLNREVTGPSPNVVAVSATTDAFEDFDALFGGSDTTTTTNATEQPVAAMTKAGSIDPNFFMFEPEISPAVTSFLQSLPDFSYVLKS